MGKYRKMVRIKKRFDLAQGGLVSGFVQIGLSSITTPLCSLELLDMFVVALLLQCPHVHRLLHPQP